MKATQTINKVVSSIDWKKIKSYHAKIGIKWEYVIDKEIAYKVPSIPELKSELASILHHMAEEKLDYISHGSWVIFWEIDAGDIRVIFRIADFSFEDYTGTKQSLEADLKNAVDSEDYEVAAVIRDKINKENANRNCK